MTIIKKLWQNSEIILEYSSKISPPVVQAIEIKGWGHPDKLADDLAEALSREYSKYTFKECGAILHHNFDKLCLLGGCSEVAYGSGKLTRPIKILVNGRASKIFAGKKLGINELIIATCKIFFAQRLNQINPEQDLEIILNISDASSPGRVFSSSTTPRHYWFAPRGIEDLPEQKRLYANDTSLGTGYFPLTAAEILVKNLSDYLSKRPRVKCPLWLGTDTKVMACVLNEHVDLTICAPQIAKYVASKIHYIENLEWLKEDIGVFLRQNHPNQQVSFNINARDNIETEELYLTATGSSIESGDEGVVGRGNRVNGLITPMRPMNLEGVNGKNPVYHVGKVYNVLANRIAKEIFERFNCSAVVNLISKTGSDLLNPWKLIIQVDNNSVPESDLIVLAQELCNKIPELTKEIVSSPIDIFPLS